MESQASQAQSRAVEMDAIIRSAYGVSFPTLSQAIMILDKRTCIAQQIRKGGLTVDDREYLVEMYKQYDLLLKNLLFIL